MAYDQSYNDAFGGNAQLGQRTIMAVTQQALNIYASSSTTSAVHVARRALATKVLNDPAGYGQRFLYVTALGNNSDNALDNAISNAWNAMAGA